MSKLRVAAAATAVSLIGAFASMGPANAATGVGTTETNSALVDVALGTAGSLLHLRVLPDAAQATVDPIVGPTSAFSQMSALTLTSSILPGLGNISIPTLPFKSAATASSPTNTFSGVGVNLASLGVPAAVATGSVVPVSLTSAIDNTGAHSGLNATLANVGLVGGLLSLKSVTSNLGALGGSSVSNGSRGISVDTLSVLDLGALLKGLGLDLNNLPIPVVSSILQTLQLPVGNLPLTTPLGTQAGTLQSTITALTGVLTANNGGVPNPLGDLLGSVGLASGDLTAVNGLLGGLGLGTLATGDAFSVVSGLITTVQGLLGTLLNTALDALKGVSLLKLSALDIGAATKAVNSVSGSSSSVTGTLGHLSVGGIDLGTLDLSAALSTVTGVLDTLNTTLNGVLSPLGLANLLHVGFFEKASNNGVTSSGGYVRSLAGITGLNISITPPSLSVLQGLLTGLPLAGGIGGVIGALPGGVVPAASGGAASMNLLNGLLPAVPAGGIVGALLGGASLKLASLSSGSNFAAPGATAAATPVSSLPRTGANTTIFLLVGLLMVGGVIVGRRYIPLAVTTKK